MPKTMKYIISLILLSHSTCLNCDPSCDDVIVPIEKMHTAAIAHAANTVKLMKKKTIGTRIILKVLPRKSAAASSMAIEITIDLHMHITDKKQSVATPHRITASTFNQVLELFYSL